MSYYYSTTTSVFATNYERGKRKDHHNYEYRNIDKTSTSLIFPVTSDPEVHLMMLDDTDYREHWLLTEFQDKPEQDMSKSAHDDSYSTALSDTTPSLMDEDVVREAASNIRPQSRQSTPNKSTAAETPPEANSTSAVRLHCSSSSIGVPNKFDILCGQSRICATHTGNCRFQVVLDIYAPKYENISSKQEKMALTKEIVGCIHMAGGEFLKYKDGGWEKISDVMARDKVSHALRTKVASWKRQQGQPNEKAAKQNKPSEKVTPIKKSRHSRHSKLRRSSTSIIASSFDASDKTKSSVMDDLLKAQREIFASLTQSEHGTSSTNEQHPLKK
jgi:hypothetical protein